MNVRELAALAFHSPDRFSVGDRLGIGNGDLFAVILSANRTTDHALNLFVATLLKRVGTMACAAFIIVEVAVQCRTQIRIFSPRLELHC